MKPLLLMIPGFFCDERIWSDVSSRLGDACEIRIADVASQASISAMASDAWALAAAEPPERPVIPCGFSMGGYVAIAMLAAPARRAAAVALIDTSSRPEAPGNIAVREKTIAAIERDIGKAVENLVALNLGAESLKDAALVERVRQMMLGVGAGAAVRQLRAIIGRGDHRELLRTLELPALVFCANEDKVLPPELSRESAALLRNSTLTFTEGANHLTPLEQPDAVAEALRELLRRIAA